MLGRRIGRWLGMALGMALVLPGTADAQLRGTVAFEFDFGGRGEIYFHSGYITQTIPRVGTVYVQPVRYERVRGIRIPGRLRPHRGFCRLWYVGVAPRYQPPAVRCDDLRGSFHRDVLVVTWRGVLRPVVLSSRLAFYRDVRVRDARYRNGRVAARVQAPVVRGGHPGYKQDPRYRYDDRYDRYEWDGRWDDHWWDDDRDGRWDDDDRDRGDRNGRRGGQNRNRRGIR